MNEASTPIDNDGSGAPSRASGSSFYTAMRILPRAQREAMFEIYSFCRLVDDVADSTAPHAERRPLLTEWRNRIEGIYAGQPPSDLQGLAKAVADFNLQKEDFLAVIDGMDMDAAEDIRAPNWTKLDLYCDRVASAVGRLSVRVFGMRENDGLALAHHLGRALQLTNILRDIDEDAGRGRLYLPREKLAGIGLAHPTPDEAIRHPRIGEVCRAVAAEAQAHYDATWAIIARSPRKATKAARLMAAAYRLYLDAVLRRGWEMPRARVKPGKPALLWVALRHGIV